MTGAVMFAFSYLVLVVAPNVYFVYVGRWSWRYFGKDQRSLPPQIRYWALHWHLFCGLSWLVIIPCSYHLLNDHDLHCSRVLASPTQYFVSLNLIFYPVTELQIQIFTVCILQTIPNFTDFDVYLYILQFMWPRPLHQRCEDFSAPVSNSWSSFGFLYNHKTLYS